VKSHCSFRDKYDLNFPLLSDPEGKVIRAYGAWGEKNMYGKKSEGIIRTTVVIGPDGKVTRVFPRVKVDGHVDKVLEAI
jgi:peroxiredoxin Q/BCP